MYRLGSTGKDPDPFQAQKVREGEGPDIPSAPVALAGVARPQPAAGRPRELERSSWWEKEECQKQKVGRGESWCFSVVRGKKA